MFKTCSKCKSEKVLSCFNKSNHFKDRLSIYCKDCAKEKSNTWKKENIDKFKQSTLKQRRSLKTRFKQSKRRSEERNLEWSISIDDFSTLIKHPCYYCNNLLGKISETRCGLDRLDNNLGYISGNCVSCCHFCNRLKMDIFTPEETKAMVDLVLKMRGIILG